MKQTPYYHFWNPASGFYGGLVLGLVALVLMAIFGLKAAAWVIGYAITAFFVALSVVLYKAFKQK